MDIFHASGKGIDQVDEVKMLEFMVNDLRAATVFCVLAIFAGMVLVGPICFCYHRKTICPEIRYVSERMDFLPNS